MVATDGLRRRAKEEHYDKHMVLLDTDIVVIGDLLHLFKEVREREKQASAGARPPQG